MTNTTAITHLQQKYGTVTYLSDAHRDGFTTFTGWLYLNGDRVIARAKRGRNVWHLTGIDRVINFKEEVK